MSAIEAIALARTLVASTAGVSVFFQRPKTVSGFHVHPNRCRDIQGRFELESSLGS